MMPFSWVRYGLSPRATTALPGLAGSGGRATLYVRSFESDAPRSDLSREPRDFSEPSSPLLPPPDDPYRLARFRVVIVGRHAMRCQSLPATATQTRMQQSCAAISACSRSAMARMNRNCGEHSLPVPVPPSIRCAPPSLSVATYLVLDLRAKVRTGRRLPWRRGCVPRGETRRARLCRGTASRVGGSKRIDTRSWPGQRLGGY